MRLSKIHGKGIYDENATQLGVVKDILIDVEKGGVYCLLKEEASKVFTKDKNAAKGTIKKAIVPYDKVRAMGDIVLIGEKQMTSRAVPERTAQLGRTELVYASI